MFSIEQILCEGVDAQTISQFFRFFCRKLLFALTDALLVKAAGRAEALRVSSER